ncbi:hypothetical protein SLI_3186 [Streptomyces lividans 1326]|uniref:Uncharacterized protein n=1 Tax=Streptomyces lividans 1326 TaxID=1200984 RepID=A0A7U9DPR9_STRLI|nr:hypothetical protein SLI_3186 [Streptomyces lividans 1326]
MVRPGARRRRRHESFPPHAGQACFVASFACTGPPRPSRTYQWWVTVTTACTPYIDMEW